MYIHTIHKYPYKLPIIRVGKDPQTSGNYSNIIMFTYQQVLI